MGCIIESKRSALRPMSYPSTSGTNMGKSIPSAANDRSVATRVVAAHYLFPHPDSTCKCRRIDLDLSSSTDLNSTHRRKPPNRLMEGGATVNRLPLSEVVSNCVRCWFQDTLKEARAGDTAMQVLVGQMYYSGYGVPRDAQRGRAWMTRASRTRSSVWKVSDKHPGYNASDSDSDEVKCDSKQ